MSKVWTKSFIERLRSMSDAANDDLHRHVVNLDRLSRWIDESGITLSSRGLWALSLKLEGHYWEGGSFSGVAPVEVRCAFVWVRAGDFGRQKPRLTFQR
jgi:hypothetical protein